MNTHDTPLLLAPLALASLLVTSCGGSDGGPAAELAAQPVQALSSLRGSVKDLAVELHEGTNMAADVSPDGKRIAFTVQGVLWVMPLAGGRATRLTSWDTEASAPVWSPDGTRIAFQNYDADGNYHIWTVQPDGAAPTRITSGPFDDREPAWMPDGASLVFASDRGQDGQYKIWRVDLNGRDYRALTQGPGAESHPAISPDGKMLAFADAGSIFTKPVDGAEPPRLQGPGSMPAWLPRSDGLAFQTTARSLSVGGKAVATGEDHFPFPVRWLPDGRFLYTADGRIKIRAAAGDALTEVPFSATLQLRRPVFARSRDRGFDLLGEQPVKGISSPVISPDGRQVTFVALNDVWVMKIGEPPVRLTQDRDRDANPQFTPDGQAIYFSSEKGNAGVLAVDKIDLSTKARTRLAAIAGQSMLTPQMSPSGDRIAYTTGAGTIEVWDLGARTGRRIAGSISKSNQLGRPSWLPGGGKIVVADNEGANNRFREGYNKLRVIDVATGGGSLHAVAEAPRQIADREEGTAVVSPDGSKVAFIMDAVLHVMPLKPDGSPADKPVAITREAADMPSWAGDSRTILYKAADRLKTIGADGSGAVEVPLTLRWKQAVAPRRTVVHAGRLWNGREAGLQSDVDIVIESNRITAIRAHDPAVAADANTRFIDASQLTVLPGLWEAHTHPSADGMAPAAMLAYGITSAQFAGGSLHRNIETREALASGNMLGPRLFVTAATFEGNRTYYSTNRSMRTPEAADLEIAKAGAMGVDYLKAYVRVPAPIMLKIAQAGLDWGIPSGTHILSPGAAAGLAGTTHLQATQRMGYGWAKSASSQLTYQDAQDLHAKGDFRLVDTLFSSVPLVGADQALISGDRFKLLIPPSFVNGLRNTAAPNAAVLSTIRRDAEQSAKVQRAGGLLAMGSDAPAVVPAIALHTNLRASAMVSSNFQALQNVTINAARMSMVDKDLGTVEVGKLADLTMVRGNPLQDIHAAANVEFVVKNGVGYSLDEILAPFRTPAALAMRSRTLVAYQRLCRADPHGCEVGAGAHGH